MSEQPFEANILSHLRADFKRRFDAEPRIFRAPGRVNLIGEHTDYNDGFVLPAAIDLYTWAAFAPRRDHFLHVFSENLQESATIDLQADSPQPKDHWSDYVQGVARMLQNRGIGVAGANIELFSNVPSGAGLSSSAALEVSIASGLLAFSGGSLKLEELALICQRAENEFVGARVGIMDQFASCFGSEGHAILLDCRSLEYQRLPLPRGAAMIICNTMVKHGHSGGEYNDRREQCEEGVRILQRSFPSIIALRDLSLAQLDSQRSALSPLTFRRCHHVITENLRVLRFVKALQSGNLKTIGECMAESHLSLKNDYEVSCRELDIMVEIAAQQPAVIGSRMTGGGFGGCTINLVRTNAAEGFKQRVAADYRRATQIEPEIYVSSAGAGVSEIVESVQHHDRI